MDNHYFLGEGCTVSGLTFFDANDVFWFNIDRLRMPIEEMLSVMSVSSTGIKSSSHNRRELDLQTTSEEYTTVLMEIKTSFDVIPLESFNAIRGLTNPFECLGKGPRKLFINRSAMKLANLDFILNIVDVDKYRGQNLNFVDVCGGPGGFTEYILQKCNFCGIKCTGYGISLEVTDESSLSYSCNWKLSHLQANRGISVSDEHLMETEADCSFRIIKGDGTGDICKINNLNSLVDSITRGGHKMHLLSLPVQIVDVVTADGGLDICRDRLDNEELSMGLMICEIISMIKTLKCGGMFILKFISIQKVSIIFIPMSDSL